MSSMSNQSGIESKTLSKKGTFPAPVPELPPLDVFENAVEPLENEADFEVS